MNNESESRTDDNPLFDIIQNLQSKLSNEQPNNTTPEPITSTSDSSEFNLNNIMEMLNNVGINKNTSNNESINTNTTASNSSNLNLDIGSIMKFQKFFNTTNQNDPRKNLLNSLKPFLRETRQKNIDTYITLLSVINALDIFTNKGSD